MTCLDQGAEAGPGGDEVVRGDGLVQVAVRLLSCMMACHVAACDGRGGEGRGGEVSGCWDVWRWRLMGGVWKRRGEVSGCWDGRVGEEEGGGQWVLGGVADRQARPASAEGGLRLGPEI